MVPQSFVHAILQVVGCKIYRVCWIWYLRLQGAQMRPGLADNQKILSIAWVYFGGGKGLAYTVSKGRLSGS